MTIRSLLVAGLAAAGLAVVLSGSQEESSQRAIRLRFPDRVDLTGLSIRYQITGLFGGYGSYIRTRPDVREYAIDTWSRGVQAATLKAMIYCPGYRIVLLTESALVGRRVGPISIAFEPLGWVPLSGRVTSVPSTKDVRVEAVYLAHWGHEFFGILDGPVQSFTVDTTKVAADGSFALRVPDFAHDPVTTSFGDGSIRGEIRVVAREAETGNIPYSLEEIERAGQPVSLPIAAEYQRDLVLVGVPR